MKDHASSTGAPSTSDSREEKEEPIVARTVLRKRAEDLGEEEIGSPLLVDLVSGFLADASNEIPVLQQHVAAGRMQKVETVAHRLKGGGRTVGAEAVAAMCRGMEQAAREGNEERVQEAVDRLPALLEETQAEFQELMGESVGGVVQSESTS